MKHKNEYFKISSTANNPRTSWSKTPFFISLWQKSIPLILHMHLSCEKAIYRLISRQDPTLANSKPGRDLKFSSIAYTTNESITLLVNSEYSIQWVNVCLVTIFLYRPVAGCETLLRILTTSHWSTNFENVSMSSWGVNITHLPLDKMAAISQMAFSNAFLWIEKFSILIKIVPKLALMGPIEIKSSLVGVMAWRQTGNKPLPEPMMTHFTDAYMQH